MAIPFPAVAGAIRGQLWSLGTGGNYFTGRFEAAKAKAVQVIVLPGETVWDVGAHRGYFTLVLAEAVGPSGRVYAFEPDPDNLALLRRHVLWNGLRQVKVMPCALANSEGRLPFQRGSSSLAGKLDLSGDLFVDVRCPSSLVTSGECARPSFVKIDAEGAESDILEGMSPYLDDPRLALVVSTDSSQLHEACRRKLESAGLTVIDSGKLRARDPWRQFGDVELFAFGRDRLPLPIVMKHIEAIGGDP
ncbi:MAG: FkbM family methyltransferase [Armatimonadetes bacterium]|nr:FkbM family methyltransferase [Armatimonadota bacterium]